jgi:hypothetical protein
VHLTAALTVTWPADLVEYAQLCCVAPVASDDDGSEQQAYQLCHTPPCSPAPKAYGDDQKDHEQRGRQEAGQPSGLKASRSRGPWLELAVPLVAGRIHLFGSACSLTGRLDLFLDQCRGFGMTSTQIWFHARSAMCAGWSVGRVADSGRGCARLASVGRARPHRVAARRDRPLGGALAVFEAVEAFPRSARRGGGAASVPSGTQVRADLGIACATACRRSTRWSARPTRRCGRRSRSRSDSGIHTGQSRGRSARQWREIEGSDPGRYPRRSRHRPPLGHQHVGDAADLVSRPPRCPTDERLPGVFDRENERIR